MGIDAEGYGYRAGDEGIDRLLRDARTLSPAGIERAAWGWDRHEDPALMQRFHDAERAALRALEQRPRVHSALGESGNPRPRRSPAAANPTGGH